MRRPRHEVPHHGPAAVGLPRASHLEGVPVISTLLTVVVLSGTASASVTLYLLPTVVGCVRRVPGIGAIAVIDILLGWTLVGWVVALAMALRSARPAWPLVQVVQNLPPALPPAPYLPPSASQPHAADWAGPPGLAPARPGSAPPLLLPPGPHGPGDQSWPTGDQP
jgi:hypothetical protein